MYRSKFLFMAIIISVCIEVAIMQINYHVFMEQIAAEGQFPYIVAIHDKFNEDFLCGGVILNKLWILSSASCLNEIEAQDLYIAAGTVTENNKLRWARSYRVVQIVEHPEYEYDNNDLSLLKVQRVIKFNNKVNFIQLATKPLPGFRRSVMVAWTRLRGIPNLPADDLKYFAVITVPPNDCSYLLPETGTSNICTITVKPNGICSQNSGSIIISQDKLHGIITKSYRCQDDYPNVFLRINSYIDWISKVTGVVP